MRFILLYLFCLTFFSCSTTEEELKSINDSGKTIFNKDIEGNWLSVHCINTFNNTKSIDATMKSFEIWTELEFSQNGQLKSHTIGRGLPVSYNLDTNTYTFSEKKFTWGSTESEEFHYETVQYEITHLINDTLHILQDNKKKHKYIRFQDQNNSSNLFPWAWTSFTNQWLSGKYKLIFSDKVYDIILKEKKNEMEGFENYSSWSFYSDLDQDIILFQSTPQIDNGVLRMDELYFIVDSSTRESIYLTQIVPPSSGRLKSIIKTDMKHVLKRD